MIPREKVLRAKFRGPKKCLNREKQIVLFTIFFIYFWGIIKRGNLLADGAAEAAADAEHTLVYWRYNNLIRNHLSQACGAKQKQG
jgi:hypothetical protein